MGVIEKSKKRRRIIAGLGAAFFCGCILLMSAGCGKLTCDFDEMWREAGDPGSPQVNPQNYERVEMYMTYEEVAAILGGPGYSTWEYTLAGHTTKNYDWVGRYGYHISVTFTDGLATDKSWWVPEEPESEEPGRTSDRGKPEIGKRREPPAKPGVTLANFRRVKNGMTYQEVVATFGKEGKRRGSHRIGKTELKVYEWRDDRGGYATVDFVRGRVCRRYQRGLR